MERDIEFVEELAKLLEKSAASEIEVEVGDLYIRLKRAPEGGAVKAAEEESGAEEAEGTAPKPERVPVKSPYVGFFRPVVSEGQEVGEGDLICYVEVVGVPNEVPSPVEGRVAAIPLRDGDPVEYGQILAEIEPASSGGGEG